MKSFTVGVIASLAAVAAAQDGSDGPACVVPCFTKTVTDYPPLECKEDTMFKCFCKDPFGPELQRHWVQCLMQECADTAEVVAAIEYGKQLCPIFDGSVTITDFDYLTQSTSAPGAPSTSAAAEPTSEAPAPESTTSKAEEQPSSQQSEAPSTPAGSSAAASSAPVSTVSDSHHVTVTKSVGATTTVCDEESSKHTVITVTSAHWECPHGCNGTVSTMTKVPKPQSSEPAQNPPCNGECHHTDKVPSSPSDKAHPSSQGGAKPSGSDVVVPTKSAGTPASSAPVQSPSTVVVNAGNSMAVSGLLAAAGVAVAVFRL